MRNNLLGLVRDNNHGAIFTFFEKLDLAFFVKSAIAYGDDFINQKTIKINRQGYGKASRARMPDEYFLTGSPR